MYPPRGPEVFAISKIYRDCREILIGLAVMPDRRLESVSAMVTNFPSGD
jgi:hypothetical protein